MITNDKELTFIFDNGDCSVNIIMKCDYNAGIGQPKPTAPHKSYVSLSFLNI